MTHLIRTCDVDLISNAWPKDLQYRILLACEPQVLVKFSGVHLAVSKFFTNDFFKELLIEKNPYLLPRNDKNRFDIVGFQGLSLLLTKLFPKNCWKIATCYFAAGNFNFHEKFLQERISETHKEAQEQLKKICGDGNEDPSSLIHQALVENEKTKKELKNRPEDFPPIIQGREQQLLALIEMKESAKNIEESRLKIIDSNPALIPLANLVRCRQLEGLKQNCEKVEKEMKAALENHAVFINIFMPVVHSAMTSQLNSIVVRAEEMTVEDMKIFQSAFKMWAKAAHGENMASAMNEITQLISGRDQDLGAPYIANMKKVKSWFADCLADRLIDDYAKQPLDSLAHANFESKAQEIYGLQPNPPENDVEFINTFNSIKEKMWNAIQERISREGLGELPENIKQIKFAVYRYKIHSFARALSIFSNEEIESKAKELEKIFSYDLKGIIDDLKCQINLAGKAIIV